MPSVLPSARLTRTSLISAGCSVAWHCGHLCFAFASVASVCAGRRQIFYACGSGSRSGVRCCGGFMIGLGGWSTASRRGLPRSGQASPSGS